MHNRLSLWFGLELNKNHVMGTKICCVGETWVGGQHHFLNISKFYLIICQRCWWTAILIYKCKYSNIQFESGSSIQGGDTFLRQVGRDTSTQLRHKFTGLTSRWWIQTKTRCLIYLEACSLALQRSTKEASKKKRKHLNHLVSSSFKYMPHI